MAQELAKEATELLKKHGLNSEKAYWHHKQSGQWIMKHVYCELLATAEGITFLPPLIIEANTEANIAVVCVTGKNRGGDETWSMGEASPSNYKQKGANMQMYPWAIAEKRAKDRVILKLVGLHGIVYSDVEADDFNDSDNTHISPTEKQEMQDQWVAQARGEMGGCDSVVALQEWWIAHSEYIRKLRPAQRKELEDCKEELKTQLSEHS